MNNLTRHDRWAHTPIPHSLQNPPAFRVFEIVNIIIGASFILLCTLNSLRNQRLTYGFLFLLNSLLCYWMETIGDWGQHLVYSPRFWRHSMLDWLPYKSPNDPAFVPFAYAVYWTAHSIMLMQLAPILQRYWRQLTILQCVLIISLPLNYAFDISVEGLCTYLGYWTYDPGFGPVIHWPGGGRQPLTWPILLMSGWPNLVAYWGGKPPLKNLNIIERWFKLDTWTEPNPAYVAAVRDETDSEDYSETSPLLSGAGVNDIKKATAWWGKWSTRDAHDAKLEYKVKDTVPRWRYELARFGAWFIVFQVSFFVTLVVPLVLRRIASGHDSEYVP
ncbi:hypothetical protein K432DRAFT_404150 [Lepidopterella palustris CBS 459.81]|uniref:Uncharacterized protein n=1 Tax=Lepidopterella palustris CBS 459.81 TaxID=1314670 RepID=A0A8E2EBZ4_9PEZI|nr:hypothetical protein K432DRAFT_404150 [Lepidopterella palustris CBS 459.81]